MTGGSATDIRYQPGPPFEREHSTLHLQSQASGIMIFHVETMNRNLTDADAVNLMSKAIPSGTTHSKRQRPRQDGNFKLGHTGLTALGFQHRKNLGLRA